MAGSDEVNSRPVENHENARIQLTGAELQALVDNAVTRALDRQNRKCHLLYFADEEGEDEAKERSLPVTIMKLDRQGSQQQQQHPRDPSEDPHFEAVTPPPPPPTQPVMPDPPRRRRSGARMSTRGGEFHFSTPRHSSGSHYPSVPEEGPSSPAQEVNSAPVAHNSPPFGDDRPLPPYATNYNPYEPSSQAHYNYNYERDPYVVAARYDARYPDRAHGPPRAPDYLAHGYPTPPRPPVPQPQPRFSPPE
ncbi:cyclin-K-like [Helianthus annuus]|uniref:cyclin-K-like n=1 Tax=Helianthus annuus TaxID=4232 RepID=UPI000B8FCE83|nr:cyclin-K-like [Helianthus annuus]